MDSTYIADKPLGYIRVAAGGVDTVQTLAALATAAGIPNLDGVRQVLITPEVQAVRWRSDGTSPTTAIGYPLAVGAELQYTASNIGGLRIIAQVAGAVLNIDLYG